MPIVCLLLGGKVSALLESPTAPDCERFPSSSLIGPGDLMVESEDEDGGGEEAG